MTTIETMIFEHGLQLIQAVVYVFIGWAVWSAKRVFVTHDLLRETLKDLDAKDEALKAELDAIKEAQAQKTSEQEQLRQKLENLPTVPSFNDLALSVKGIEGDIKAINASMDGWKHATKRIERIADMITAAGFEGLK